MVWLSQTILSVDETIATVERLRPRFPSLQDPPSNDISYATQNRRAAVKALTPEGDWSLWLDRKTHQTRICVDSRRNLWRIGSGVLGAGCVDAVIGQRQGGEGWATDT